MKQQIANVPGLSRPEIDLICSILQGVGEAWVFGSRATGRHRPFSDVDIALVAAAPIADHVLAALKMAFQDSDLPFRVDLVDEKTVSSDFRRLIHRDAIQIL